jgi:hypothetical protein
MFSGLRLALSSLLLGLCLLSPPAVAQSEAENRAAARALAVEGVALAEAGDCTAAIDRFSRAEQLFHAPTILTGLGECQCKVGLLVEGTESLNQAARENLGPNPPDAFVQAQERARTLLAEYLPKVAKLTLQVQTPTNAPFVVTIDGARLPVAMVGAPRPINPGEHQIKVEGDTYLPATATVTLAEGASETATLTLELRPQAEVAPPPPPPPDVPAETAEPSRVPAYIAFGVGAVGLGVGTVFGLSAMSTKSDLEKVCVDGGCPPSAQSDIDSMQSSATVATIGFGVGLVAVGVGAYLWLSAEPEAAPAVGVQQPRGFGLRAVLSPGYVGLNGDF